MRRTILHRADLCWTSVDKVSDEDRLSLGVTPGASRVAIAERSEQCLQLVRLPVDVPDDVIGHACQLSDVLLRRGRLWEKVT